MICEKIYVANLYQTKDSYEENKIHYPIITKESFKERKHITNRHSHSPTEYPKEQTKETIFISNKQSPATQKNKEIPKIKRKRHAQTLTTCHQKEGGGKKKKKQEHMVEIANLVDEACGRH